MTAARKDDKYLIESIFCHKPAIYDHKNAIQDHAKSQKATHGYEMQQEKH